MGCFSVTVFFAVCGGILGVIQSFTNEELILIGVLLIVLFIPIVWVLIKDSFFKKETPEIDNDSTERTIDTPKKDVKEHSDSFDPAKLAPYDYEKYVAKYLLDHGYKSAEVTQQSADYGIDIITVNSDGWKIAVQCKRYQGSVGVAAVQEVIAGKEYYGCDLAAVYTTGAYTEQAKNMAQRTHVKLYVLDKNGLRMIN